jgi:hypothetical protein
LFVFLPVSISNKPEHAQMLEIWLHCLLLEHVENTEKNMGKKMAGLFSDLYIRQKSPTGGRQCTLRSITAALHA